jgi:hypothetical protein
MTWGVTIAAVTLIFSFLLLLFLCDLRALCGKIVFSD